MKCDKLQLHRVRGEMFNGEEICGGFAYYDADEVDEAIAELKARIQLDDDEMAGFLDLEEECGGGDLRNYIAELKAENERLVKDNERIKRLNEIVHSELVSRKWVDYNRRLTLIALWLARAERAKEAFLKWNLFPNFETTDKLFTIDEYDETQGATDGQVLRTCEGWAMVWQNVERKCRAKAEEYR